MSRPLSKLLEVRLVMTVGLSLLLFSVIAGVLVFHLSYRDELDRARSLQRQLVGTVQVQAEVAAFATNRQIAQGVLEGLLMNPVILAASIDGRDGFRIERGSRRDIDFGSGTRYPLFSPVNHLERIGSLVVVQDDAQVNLTASRSAAFQTGLMLAQVMLAALILAVVLRVMLINPIKRLAREIETIQPGSSLRLKVDANDANNEIGILANSANALLDTAQAAIEEVNSQRNELERLATHDQLTGLPLLRLAQDRLEVACHSARRSETKVAVLFVDLDGFKAINDSCGHEVGDEVLREAATRLSACVRAEDTAARIGGDEFLVILGNLPEASAAAQVATSIGAAISRPIETGGKTLQLGASIGIALFPDHTENVDRLRPLADLAMYEVKNSGKGRFGFASFARAPQGASELRPAPNAA